MYIAYIHTLQTYKHTYTIHTYIASSPSYLVEPATFAIRQLWQDKLTINSVKNKHTYIHN